MISPDLYDLVMSHTHGNTLTRTILINGKARTISVYTDEDQELHRKIKDVLWKDYRKRFSPNCYAYVKGKSCIDAIFDINKKVRKYGGYIRTDIKGFFPSISRELLGGMLRMDYPEDFVNKVLSFVAIGGIGISQGSALSPLLSNIYLMQFDETLSAICRYYRYSDDMLILCDRSYIDSVLASIDSGLQALLLTRSIEKTFSGDLNDGFHYLGFYVNKKGVCAALNKKTELDEKVMDICAAGHSTIKERMDKMHQSCVSVVSFGREPRFDERAVVL